MRKGNVLHLSVCSQGDTTWSCVGREGEDTLDQGVLPSLKQDQGPTPWTVLWTDVRRRRYAFGIHAGLSCSTFSYGPPTQYHEEKRRDWYACCFESFLVS